MKVKEMKVEQRPREKALRFGLKSLTDRELLAILLQSGNKNHTVFEIADDILKITDGLAKLFDLHPNALMDIPGIREGKALQLMASIELCRRALQAKAYETVIRVPEDLVRWFQLEYGYAKQEHFIAVYLNTKGKIISHHVLFIGTLNESCVHPRDIFKEAFLENACSVIVLHNHPSGDPAPSQEDIRFTLKLKEIAAMMSVQFLDHLIISKNDWFSFRQSAYLD